MHTSHCTRPFPHTILAWCWSLLLALMLSACGGGDSASSSAPRLLSGGTVKAGAAPADYATVVQQLYVAYFGRPADPGGLANFETQLQAAGASSTIQGLDSAYSSNVTLRALVDTFGVSKESQSLYSGDSTAFVKAIYNNVLGRDPLPGGLDYWVAAIDHGGLQRGNVALSIMSAALTNTSAQGQADAALIGKKITIAADFTAAVPASTYRGQGPASMARTMLGSVKADTDVSAFQGTIGFTIAAINQANVATFAGVYTGTYTGDDAGTFSVAVGPTGIVTGDSKSTTYGYTLNVLGQLVFGGNFSMTASGSAGSATYRGSIDPSTGALSGTWDAGSAGKGTFSGSKVY